MLTIKQVVSQIRSEDWFVTIGKPFCMIKVMRRCLRALDMWKKPWFLSQGPVLGAPCRRVTLTTDTSLTGWGAVMSGRSAQGLWEGPISCGTSIAWRCWQYLKHFLPDLRGHHVLVCTDNTSVVSYILRSKYPVETGAEARGNRSSTPRWWSRFGRSLVEPRWTCLRLERSRNVPSGFLGLIQLHSPSGYVCNHGFPRNEIQRRMPYFLHPCERLASSFQKLLLLVPDALLSSLVSTSPRVSPFRWTDYTHFSERENPGALPKASLTQCIVPRGNMVTYVTWDVIGLLNIIY